MAKPFKTAIVFGAGAFGTSIASVLSHTFEKVILKVRSKDVYDCLKEGENSIYLPGQKLSENIIPALDWDELNRLSADTVELLVSGLPTSAIRNYCQDHQHIFEFWLQKDVPFISLSKGIDTETLEMPDDLFIDQFPEFRDQFCFLSGPSFAKEIVDKQITVVSVAGRSKVYLEKVSKMLNNEYFKIFPTYDIKGLLLGGALKNVLAIAGGIVEGLGYNHNTRAALITRGIHEMLRFGIVFNARPETFYGLSGMGDLILTTTGGLSRNKQFGLEVAKGRSVKEILNSQRTVVEGYKTTKAAYHLSKKYDIRCPIFQGIYRVLYEEMQPSHVIQQLMRLPVRFDIT